MRKNENLIKDFDVRKPFLVFAALFKLSLVLLKDSEDDRMKFKGVFFSMAKQASSKKFTKLMKFFKFLLG